MTQHHPHFHPTIHLQIELRNKEKNKTEGDEAACKLQALYRGRLERRGMRQWIAQMYCKRFDDRRQRAFYENVYTQEKTWHRPFIHRRLFPESHW